MKIHVLFFSQIREALGEFKVVMDVEQGMDIQTLMKELQERFNGYDFSKHQLIYAVNEDFTDISRRLNDKDELAVMTPMSGG